MAARPPDSAPSRRRFLAWAGLAPLLAAARATPAGATPDVFTHGPAALDVTSRSALVWHRGRAGDRIHVEYGPAPALAAALRSPAIEVRGDTDCTTVVELTGLVPGREYTYRGVATPADGVAVRGPMGRFRTAPERHEAVTLGWGADLDSSHRPFAIFDAIGRQRPDLFLLIGDTAYADPPREARGSQLGFYRFKHRLNRDDEPLQRFLAGHAVAAMWDDHEVADNFNRTHRRIPEGRRAFREYWPVRGAGRDPTALYRRLAWGAVDVFMLDCRQYRDPQLGRDGPGKTMLGARQKAWFLEELAASRAPFKVLVSSVPFLGAWSADKWAGYATERDELLRFVHDQGIGGVLILSGDIHAARDASGPRGVREFTAGPLAAGALCRVAPRFRTRAQEGFFYCDGYTYGLVRVTPDADPPRADVEIRDGSDALLHRATVVVEPTPSGRRLAPRPDPAPAAPRESGPDPR